MKSAPSVSTTAEELRRWRDGLAGSVAFVPTMGALHGGHASLLKRARERGDHVVLSIFVNPTQFGPSEDFSKYPRALARDLEIAALEGVAHVFHPTVEVIYPRGYSTFIEETRVSQPLCGPHRPGHFRGVATVVHRLFQLVRPDIAIFGMKDAQQFFVIERMARDLGLTVSVEGACTVREESGLALSSRNVYLSADERERAVAISRVLKRSALDLDGGQAVEGVIAAGIAELRSAGFNVQYVECVGLPDFQPLRGSIPRGTPALFAIAAFMGTTRLIDNVILGSERLREQGLRMDTL